jgi:hypothetical protein
MESAVARPSDATIKRLFAMSHNLCAHPDCGQPLVEGSTIVGEVCHIKGDKSGAARYDPDQADAERHAFKNLSCMCRKHHKIIDTEEENYSVEWLLEIKRTHEGSDSRRYVITDELVQRLGEMLAAEAEDRPRASAATAYPDWEIRELFFHIRPDLIEGPDERRCEQVARQVMDHFSTGRLSVWGRPIAGSRRGSLKRVDEPGFWDHAQFTCWFSKEDGAENCVSITKSRRNFRTTLTSW